MHRSKTASLFDDFVGKGEQRRGHSEAKRLRGLEVDDQLKLGRCLHRKVGSLLASQDANRHIRQRAGKVRWIKSV